MWKPTETGVHMGATVQTADSHLLASMKGISLDSWPALSSRRGAQGLFSSGEYQGVEYEAEAHS